MVSQTSPTAYFITGANRGLGRGLTEAYLLHPNSLVIAGVRDPSNASSKSLESLPKHETSRLLVVPVNSNSPTSAAEAAEILRTKHGITSLDMVIANAGISTVFPRVEDLKPEQLWEHVQVNVIGVVWLFQATLSLLKASTKEPKWMSMSSGASWITDMEQIPMPNAAYGTSKAALNYITKKIALENDWLNAFAMDPGWVQTDMGNAGAIALGFESAEITTDVSVNGMVAVIDGSTKEKTSGTFYRYTGERCNW